MASSNSVKCDKILVQKIRDLKNRHSEIISSLSGGLGVASQLTPQDEVNIEKENQ